MISAEVHGTEWVGTEEAATVRLGSWTGARQLPPHQEILAYRVVHCYWGYLRFLSVNTLVLR